MIVAHRTPADAWWVVGCSLLGVPGIPNGPPDGTGQLADQMAAADARVHVLHRPGKGGLGKAYIAGFRWALERDYELVFEMDADFSHDPKFLVDFLRAVEDADLVVGSRYKTGVNVINWPISRLLLSLGANQYARWITGLPITPITFTTLSPIRSAGFTLGRHKGLILLAYLAVAVFRWFK